jgi:hypothetical protein
MDKDGIFWVDFIIYFCGLEPSNIASSRTQLANIRKDMWPLNGVEKNRQ